ncbi:MAG TPA: hypothetical protein VNJ71_12840 [Gemmatimonadales bacterium]|nr:hypothetical protein [Gemmatimonadales bacterium]
MIRRVGRSVAARAGLSALAGEAFLAEVARACPVCVGTGFPRRAALAYLGITGLLSALALILAGLVFWLARRAADRAGSAPSAAGADPGNA